MHKISFFFMVIRGIIVVVLELRLRIAYKARSIFGNILVTVRIVDCFRRIVIRQSTTRALSIRMIGCRSCGSEVAKFVDESTLFEH